MSGSGSENAGHDDAHEADGNATQDVLVREYLEMIDYEQELVEMEKHPELLAEYQNLRRKYRNEMARIRFRRDLEKERVFREAESSIHMMECVHMAALRKLEYTDMRSKYFVDKPVQFTPDPPTTYRWKNIQPLSQAEVEADLAKMVA